MIIDIVDAAYQVIEAGNLFANVGLIVRQRAQLLPWLLIFAMVGLEQRSQRRQLKRQARAAELVVAAAR